MKKTHILLVNLGSPGSCDIKSIRSYLQEFLSDIRVVDISRLLWLPVLYGLILNIRPKKIVKNYQKIWSNHHAPLIQTSIDIVKKLNNTLKIPVHLAMRYGNPSIQSILDNINKIDELIIIPMFPQYSSATSASVFDTISRYYANKRYIPTIKFINNYHSNSYYIAALANSITKHWKQHKRSKKLIIAFHGMPKRYIETGDIYQQQCETTANLLAKKLKLNDNDWIISFQSRFGKEQWLTPYLCDILENLPKENIDSVDVISPGFSADCLETLEELAISGKQQFLKAGGKVFNYISALNTTSEHILMWQHIIETNLPHQNLKSTQTQ